MRRPAASSLAMIGPITFLATASGLMIENVRSMAISDSLEVDGSYPRGRAGSMRQGDVDVAVDLVGTEVGPADDGRGLAGGLRGDDLRKNRSTDGAVGLELGEG